MKTRFLALSLLTTLAASGLAAQLTFNTTTTLPHAIPDNSTAGTTLNIPVSGLTQDIVSVRVDITLTHAYIGDLICRLEGPLGTPTHDLFNRVGRVTAGAGSSTNFAGAYGFSDAAAGDLWATVAGQDTTFNVSSVDYRTTTADSSAFTSLGATFIGMTAAQADGTWTLFISDNSGLDTGSITALSITISGGLVVTSLNDSGAGSLRDAIAAASSTAPGDTIAFQPNLSGTVTLASQLVINKSLTIIGPTGASGITVSGNNAVRCVYVTASGADSVSISNLTLLNGAVTSNDIGGGMLVDASLMSVQLNNIRFEGCTTASAGAGGGLYAFAASMVLTDCVFLNNTAGNGGGMRQEFTGAVTLDNCLFEGNTALSGSGGGGSLIRLTGASSSLTITNCVFRNNSSNLGSGGGLLVYRGAVITVTNSSFEGNSTTSTNAAGGGVFLRDPQGQASFTSCTFSGNTSASIGGGGVIVSGESPVNQTATFTNCTISGNSHTGSGYGGGLMLYGSGNTNMTVELVNCTVANNTCATPANGISIGMDNFFGLGTLTCRYRNTIISGTGTTHIVGASSGTSNLVSDDNNICSDGTGNLTGTHDQPNTDPLLAALVDNGGPTMTHMPLPGSPAIDKGRAISGVTKDQRGMSRPLDHSSVTDAGNGDGSDIGSVEAPLFSILEVNRLAAINRGDTDNVTGTIVGITDTVTWDLDNSGEASLVVTGITVSNESNVNATVTSGTSITITVGGATVDVEIDIEPTGTNWSFDVTIVSNDPLGDFTFTVSGTASSNTAPVITSAAAPTTAADGMAFSHQFTATGNPNPTFAVTTGTLPGWATLTPAGLLSGTPALGQDISVTVSAQNGIAPDDTEVVAITVVGGVAPVITSGAAPTTAADGVAFSHQFTATGNPNPTFAVTTGTLPGWATLTPAGLLSGIPALGQDISVTVSAQNGIAPDDTEVVAITVVGGVAPVITSGAAPTTATVGVAYSHTFVATGTPAATFSATGLPAWLTLNPTTGLLSGTPSAGDVGTAGPITVTAANGVGPADTEVFSILVAAAGGGGGGGGGGGDDDSCSTDTGSNSWLLLAGILSMLVLATRLRSTRA